MIAYLVFLNFVEGIFCSVGLWFGVGGFTEFGVLRFGGFEVFYGIL